MTGIAPEASLRDELSAGFDATPDAPPPVAGDPAALEGAPPPLAGTETLPPGTPAPPVPPAAELPPLEAPSMWKQPYRDAFGKFATNPEYRELLTKWQEQWKETEGFVTQRNQEYAGFRREAEPLLEVIKPYSQYWAQQGLSPAQGVTQVLSYAEALANDPASVIPQLAEMYGVDLRQLVAEQPYVDPEVAALKQQLAAIQNERQTWAQQQQQQQHTRIAEEIQAFQSATDEQGNPKAPHFDRVFDRMLGLARGGLAQNIQDAYDMAVRMDADLQAEITQKRAVDEAAARAAEAKKAVEASKTVQGKSTTGGPPPAMSLRDELAQGLAALGHS